jgi:hypothetical protein
VSKAIRAVMNLAKEEFTDLVNRNWARDVSLLASRRRVAPHLVP